MGGTLQEPGQYYSSMNVKLITMCVDARARACARARSESAFDGRKRHENRSNFHFISATFSSVDRPKRLDECTFTDSRGALSTRTKALTPRGGSGRGILSRASLLIGAGERAALSQWGRG
jgi:hypothetical protein